MPIEKRDINTITPYTNNPRTHSEEQINKLASLMKRYGFHDSHAIAIDESGEIIWGHGRLEAANKAGITKVPVEVLTGLTEEDKQALRIADNAIADQSEWNLELLQQELKELDDSGYQLEYLALDEGLLEDLGKSFASDAQSFVSDEQIEGENTKEIDVDEFELDHKCPKCGFQFND